MKECNRNVLVDSFQNILQVCSEVNMLHGIGQVAETTERQTTQLQSCHLIHLNKGHNLVESFTSNAAWALGNAFL